tara:strand:+ start:76 stop:582 length:507 start_codon:yes stop_codon:yes gene_type:complete
MNKLIELPETEYLPPELLLDRSHPSNDKYLKNLEGVQRRLVAISATMPRKHLDIVKLRHNGKPIKDIAAQLKINVQTVYNALNSEKGQQMTNLLRYHQQGMEGPSSAHRVNVLWRIAIENEHREPKTAISAISEMNKMTGEYLPADTKNGGITVVITNNVLQPGPLDI